MTGSGESGCLGAIGAVAVAAVTVIPLQAFAFFKAWEFFIDPLVHFSLTYSQALGIWFTWGTLQAWNNTKREVDEPWAVVALGIFSALTEIVIVFIANWAIRGANA